MRDSSLSPGRQRRHHRSFYPAALNNVISVAAFGEITAAVVFELRKLGGHLGALAT